MELPHHFMIWRDSLKEDALYPCILGKLFVDGTYICDTLEPPYLSKYGCVDEGEYDLVYHYSPSFKKQMIYLDMAKAGSSRSGIMFHSGNSASDTRGCILVGYRQGDEPFLVCSKVALNVLLGNYFSNMKREKKLYIYDKFSSK